MPEFLKRVPDQIVRLAMVFAALIAAVLAIRVFAIPKSVKQRSIRLDFLIA